MLMPIVAMMKTRAPITSVAVSWILPTMSTGSVIALPKTLMVPAVTITLTTAKAVKLTGSPQKLP